MGVLRKRRNSERGEFESRWKNITAYKVASWSVKGKDKAKLSSARKRETVFEKKGARLKKGLGKSQNGRKKKRVTRKNRTD